MAQPPGDLFSVVRVKGLKPRVDVFSKKLHANMTRLWNDATKAFITEVLKDVHIDTGMSRSSIAPLGRAVRMLTEVRAFSPQRVSRKGYTDMEGVYHSDVNRSANLGEKLGEKAFRLNYGSPARPVFRFVFNIRVYQYALHEPQWQTLERGQEAFIAYLKSNAMNYVPKLADWILPDTQG